MCTLFAFPTYRGLVPLTPVRQQGKLRASKPPPTRSPMPRVVGGRLGFANAHGKIDNGTHVLYHSLCRSYRNSVP